MGPVPPRCGGSETQHFGRRVRVRAVGDSAHDLPEKPIPRAACPRGTLCRHPSDYCHTGPRPHLLPRSRPAVQAEGLRPRPLWWYRQLPHRPTHEHHWEQRCRRLGKQASPEIDRRRLFQQTRPVSGDCSPQILLRPFPALIHRPLGKATKPCTTGLYPSSKWSGWESNPRPHHCERCALPTELPPRTSPRRGRGPGQGTGLYAGALGVSRHAVDWTAVGWGVSGPVGASWVETGPGIAALRT